MKQEILANLREHFRSIEEAYEIGDREFVTATINYSDFIARSEYLSGIVRAIVYEGEFEPEDLYVLFQTGATKFFFRAAKNPKEARIEWPLFLDKNIEEKFGLVTRFMTEVASNLKKIQKSQKDNIDIDDVAFGGDQMSNDEHRYNEMHRFRKINYKIVAKALGQEKQKVSFDEDSGDLLIGGIAIRMRKFSQQYHTLRIIFTDPKEEWFYSAIGEKLSNEKDKDFHNYISAIKRRVVVEGGINDLFLTTTQSVKINKDYL